MEQNSRITGWESTIVNQPSRIQWKRTPVNKMQLLAMRNDLVTFWGQMAELHGQTPLLTCYHQYCMTIDNLDPDNHHRHECMENAIADYRNALNQITMAVMLLVTAKVKASE